MMRYKQTFRLAGLAGLLSLVALMISAIPSGATVVCPPGTTNPAYCTNVPPAATTDHATRIRATSATLNGVSGPNVTNGDTTTYFFQYGRSTGYGKQTSPGQVGPLAHRNVSSRVGSLAPCTRYHFRIVSENPDGTTSGEDRSFRTRFLSPITDVNSPESVRHNGHFTVKVTLRIRADVTISLRFRGRTVQKFDEGTSNGTFQERIKAPGRTGNYTVRATARLSCGSQTSASPLTVT